MRFELYKIYSIDDIRTYAMETNCTLLKKDSKNKPCETLFVLKQGKGVNEIINKISLLCIDKNKFQCVYITKLILMKNES